MNIVVVCGQKRQGKDVLSNYIQKQLGDNWHRGAFAEGVKEVLGLYFGLSSDNVEKWKVREAESPPELDVPVRRSMEMIGDGFRQIKQSVWVQRLINRFKNKNVIVSDGRYPSEWHTGQEVGGITILMWRPKFLNNVQHPSESQLREHVEYFLDKGVEGEVNERGFNLFIRNDGTIEDLYKKADDIIIPYMLKKFNIV